MLTQVKWFLDEYRENYRRQDLPALELSGVYALFPEEGVADFVESRWNDVYPNAGRSGVYLIFGKSGSLLYIGKASMGASMGGRLGTHFAGNLECRLLSTDWTERPTYVATVAVPDGMSFEAPALEEYLVRRLRPCDNKLGVALEGVPGGALSGEGFAAVPESGGPEPAATTVLNLPGVYTYSAPGMPMCLMCGQRPAIFYCSTHQSAICLECVAKHDQQGVCVYLPEFRAPNFVAGPATTPKPSPSPGGSKPQSILGIG